MGYDFASSRRQRSAKPPPSSSFEVVASEEEDGEESGHESFSRVGSSSPARQEAGLKQQIWTILRPSGSAMPAGSNTSGDDCMQQTCGYPAGLEYSGGQADVLIRMVCRRLRLLSLCVFAGSAFFWSWAMYNTKNMETGQDLGIYSFAFTFLTSLWILYQTKDGPRGLLGRGRMAFQWTRCLVATSHVTVTANYMLGLWFALSAGSQVYVRFATYCAIFVLLWAYVTFYGWYLLRTLQKYEAEIANYEGVSNEADMAPLYGSGSPSSRI